MYLSHAKKQIRTLVKTESEVQIIFFRKPAIVVEELITYGNRKNQNQKRWNVSMSY